MLRRFSVFFTLVVLVVAPYMIPVSALAAANDAEARCQSLLGDHFLNLVDAPTQITQARFASDASEIVQGLERIVAQFEPAAAQAVVAETKKSLAGIQPFCHVQGYILTNVGFELLLPASHWNGKFLMVGCGGWCGQTVGAARYCALHGDYACISTDMGHAPLGGLWFRNNLQAQIDFSYRATHVVALAGKVITEHYYAKKPAQSYFSGCSTGGYQAMVEAQRYPLDFNGIIAGAPDMDESGLAVRYIWIKQNFIGPDDKPVLSSDDIQLLHRAALARCDMDDGVKDGIISDPVHCTFDPQALQCSGAKTSQCITAQQVRAVKNIYGVPVTSTGVPLFFGHGKFPGSENGWTAEFTAITWGEEYFRDTALLTEPGKEWKYTDFDFDRDVARSGIGVLFPETDPDLRAFKAAGGKLLSYEGGNDNEEIPGAIVDYYETVERTMGGRAATQDFFRLFLMPGVDHCRGGVGADAADFLGHLEAWVERALPPDRILSGHLKNISTTEGHLLGAPYPYREFPADASKLSFTRPLYPYPLYPKFKGTGDPNRGENFRSIAPSSSEQRQYRKRHGLTIPPISSCLRCAIE